MKPKDRDFVETLEGFLFCVVGYLHPSDRFTAYLKYVPSKDGNWRRGETRYRRVLPFYHVSQVENTYAWLRSRHPEYIFDCPVRNITVTAVPHDRVRKYYHPRERLQDILEEGAKDPLEVKLIDLANHVTDMAGIRCSDLGVTGSILTGSHNPEFSDLDLTVYGYDASTRVKAAIQESKRRGEGTRPLSPERKASWIESHSGRFHLSEEELELVAAKRWNYGTFDGTYFSIHPTRSDDEITERYGDWTYRRLGDVTGTATIGDNRESIYLPAVYELEDVKSADIPLPGVRYLVSFEGMYSGLFEKGQRVEFKGKLEEASSDRENVYRVVIGGAGSQEGYVKSGGG